MKRITFCMAVLTATAFVIEAWAGKDKEEPQLRLELDLVDGSRVIGIPDIESVPVQTSYAKMEIPLKQILAIKIDEDHEKASLALRNGDKLKGVVNLGPVKIETVFGKVSVGIEHIGELRVVFFSGALPEVLRQGLVLYYSFDRDEGAKVTDESGRRHEGEVHGAKWTAKGKVGGAYQFDGTSSYIDSLDTALVNGCGEITMSVWVCPFANTQYGGIVDCQTLHTVKQIGFTEQAAGTRQAAFYVNDGQTYNKAVTTPEGMIETNVWHLLTGTWKSPAAGGDGVIRMYVDGVFNSASSVRITGLLSQAASFKVGWDTAGSYFNQDWHFNGLIDEVMIFDRALAPEEIRRLYEISK